MTTEQAANNDDQEVMKTLRELLVGPETQKIENIEHKITEIAHPVATVDDIAHSLPEAIRLRITQDENLQHALQPVTEQAIQQSVINNPKPLSEALFPIMGPAIRRSINHAIGSMLQSMNQALEHSFSIRGLRWRIEAMRTGKSFAEIVMLNTLVYRVEQIFIIHRESGLLISHIATDPAMNEDADLVSSMLTAVRDFVRDSFSSDDNADIESLRLGELQLLINQGPHVTLTLVCRGNLPQELYTLMDEHLEALQREYGRAFKNFDGDTSLFVGIQDSLRPLMRADYRIEENQRSTPLRALIVIGMFLLPLIAWFGYQTYLNHLWQGYIQQLRLLPGVAILHEGKEHGHYILHGLLDDHADEPRDLIPAHLPAEDIEMHWRPYYSLEDSMILQRAIAILQPVKETSLSVHHGTLQARGAAPEQWIQRIQQQGHWIAGVQAVDVQLRNMDLEPLPDKIQRLLQPPSSVQLRLEELKLFASGECTEAWQKQARQRVDKHIPELQSYDDRKLVAVDSPAYLLAQAKAKLNPPASVKLEVDAQRVLHIRGESMTAWLQQARGNATSIPYLASLNTRNIRLIDSPAYLLALAKKRLKPPSGIALSVSPQRVLTAKGEAKQRWILQARKQAKRIPHLQSYQDHGVIDPFDRARVLRLARKALKPPKTIQLDYRQGRLYAGGTADSRWIERARKRAPDIRGVSVYDDRQVIDPEVYWQELSRKIKAVHLSFQAGTSTFKHNAEATKLTSLSADFQRLRQWFPHTRLRIIGSSSLYGDKAREVATARANMVGQLLQQQGIAFQQQQRQILIVRDQQWGVAFDVIR